jgi:thioredoxin reductase
MATSRSEHDAVVVGAGPAGLAAVDQLVRAGATVALLDAGHGPGGQFWRQPASGAPAPAGLHHDLGTYSRLVAALGRDGVRYLPQQHVWTVTAEGHGFTVHAVDRSGAEEVPVEVHGRRLVLATGAYDRQVPFPGWDLPGVMTAGGVQALLKAHGVAAGRRVVVAGTGPFLLPVAAGLVAGGADVVSVLEASPRGRWLREAPVVLRNAGKLGEAAGYLRTLAAHRVPVRTGWTVARADGGDALTSVTVARLDRSGHRVAGAERVVEADTLAVGWGFTPQVELAVGVGCRTRVDADGSVVCEVDEYQQTSVPGVYVAGEACGVGGAALALVEGRIAGAAAGRAPVPRRTSRRRAALRRFAAAVHRAHPVPDAWMDALDDDTLLCRCEEVPVGRVRAAVQASAVADARTAKLLARPGMGWCQGRVCGYATSCLTARWSGAPYDPTGLARRPVASSVTFDTLASG